MRTHPLRILAFAAALLAVGTALSAQDGPGFGPGHGPGFGRGLKALNLTEAQRTQMKALHDKHQPAIQAKAGAAQTARKALHEAMADAVTDAGTLKALHEKASAAQFDLMLEHRALRLEILPLLTPEQKAKFAQGPMGFGGRGMGHGRGMRPANPGPDAPQ
jgi:protein CpxP